MTETKIVKIICNAKKTQQQQITIDEYFVLNRF